MIHTSVSWRINKLVSSLSLKIKHLFQYLQMPMPKKTPKLATISNTTPVPITTETLLTYPSDDCTYIFFDAEYNVISLRIENVLDAVNKAMKDDHRIEVSAWGKAFKTFIVKMKIIKDHLKLFRLTEVNEKVVAFLVDVERRIKDVELTHKLKITMKTILFQIKKFKIHFDVEKTLITAEQEKFYLKLWSNTAEILRTIQIPDLQRLNQIFDEGWDNLGYLLLNPRPLIDDKMIAAAKDFERKHKNFVNQHANEYVNFRKHCDDILSHDPNETNQQFKRINEALIDRSICMDNEEISNDIKEIANHFGDFVRNGSDIARDIFYEIKEVVGNRTDDKPKATSMSKLKQFVSSLIKN